MTNFRVLSYLIQLFYETFTITFGSITFNVINTGHQTMICSFVFAVSTYIFTCHTHYIRCNLIRLTSSQPSITSFEHNFSNVTLLVKQNHKLLEPLQASLYGLLTACDWFFLILLDALTVHYIFSQGIVQGGFEVHGWIVPLKETCHIQIRRPLECPILGLYPSNFQICIS